MVVINSDGINVLRTPSIFNSMCVLDVKYFPFDEQSCDLVFASWTRDITSLDIVLGDNQVTRSRKDAKLFQENEEWRVLFANIVREEVRNKYL